MKDTFRSGIRYSLPWEDYRVIRDLLRPNEDDTVCCVCGSGLNVLNLIADNVSQVIALDINPEQLYLLQLTSGAARSLEYGDFVRFMGFMSSSDRLDYYMALRPNLNDATSTYWDKRPDSIAAGVVLTGTMERYLVRFARKMSADRDLASLVPKILHCQSTSELQELLPGLWTSQFHLQAERYFGDRWIRMSRSPEHWKLLQSRHGELGQHIVQRFTDWVGHSVPADNPWLYLLLSGTLPEDSAILFGLDELRFRKARDRINRIEMINSDLLGALERTPIGSINKLYLSNVLEYASGEGVSSIWKQIHEKLVKPGTVVYQAMFLEPEESEDGTWPEVVANGRHPLDRLWLFNPYKVRVES